MKGECDVPNIKPKYESSNEINLYSYVHQAILMPEDGIYIFKLFRIYIMSKNYHDFFFSDYMFDKDDNIEIMSTKTQSRPESRYQEDRYV